MLNNQFQFSNDSSIIINFFLNRNAIENQIFCFFLKWRLSNCSHLRCSLMWLGSPYDFYTKTGKLGEGGGGAVYAVKAKSDGKKWALKEIRKDSYDLPLLEREILVMKDLHHEGLVTMKEAFHDDTYIYLVLDVIAGGELFDRIIEQVRNLIYVWCCKLALFLLSIENVNSILFLPIVFRITKFLQFNSIQFNC